LVLRDLDQVGGASLSDLGAGVVAVDALVIPTPAPTMT